MRVVGPLVIASRLEPVSFQGESRFGNEDLLIHSQTIYPRLYCHNGAPVIFLSRSRNTDWLTIVFQTGSAGFDAAPRVYGIHLDLAIERIALDLLSPAFQDGSCRLGSITT